MSVWVNRANAIESKRNKANASFVYRDIYSAEERDQVIDELNPQAIDKDITLILMRCYD